MQIGTCFAGTFREDKESKQLTEAHLRKDAFLTIIGRTNDELDRFSAKQTGGTVHYQYILMCFSDARDRISLFLSRRTESWLMNCLNG